MGEESKTGKVRFVPVNSATRAVLDAQTRHFGELDPLPWVFVNAPSEKHYRPDSVYHAFRRAVERTQEYLRKHSRTEQADALNGVTFLRPRLYSEIARAKIGPFRLPDNIASADVANTIPCTRSGRRRRQ